MRRVKLQGRAPTISDQQRAGLSRLRASSVTDFDQLRAGFDASLFVGPPTPAHILISRVASAREDERHWRIAEDLTRYGRVDHSEKSAPYLGEVFGYGQPTYEVPS